MDIDMKIDFEGKVAVVTGAAGGIGSATARRFARAGAKVMLADLNEGALIELADELRADGRVVGVKVTDVSDESSVEALADATVAKFGRVDAWFNNAGVEGPREPTGEYPSETFASVTGVNMDGVFFGLKHAIPRMLETGGGAIVNTASIAGKKGFEGLAPYVASKHAVIGLTRTASAEYAKEGVRVNAICPGVIQTEMVERDADGDLDPYIAMEPIGRLGQPEEVAALVTFLCSEQAGFITGASVDIDGGILAQ